jgi:hypothetical protein
LYWPKVLFTLIEKDEKIIVKNYFFGDAKIDASFLFLFLNFYIINNLEKLI